MKHRAQELKHERSFCHAAMMQVTERCVTATLVRQLAHFHKELCRELFDEMDADNSGNLDRLEVKMLVLPAHCSRTHGSVQRVRVPGVADWRRSLLLVWCAHARRRPSHC